LKGLNSKNEHVEAILRANIIEPRGRSQVTKREEETHRPLNKGSEEGDHRCWKSRNTGRICKGQTLTNTRKQPTIAKLKNSATD
jgi:hypothetical protein